MRFREGYIDALCRSLVLLLGGMVGAFASYTRGEPWMPVLMIALGLTALHVGFVSFLWLYVGGRRTR